MFVRPSPEKMSQKKSNFKGSKSAVRRHPGASQAGNGLQDVNGEQMEGGMEFDVS